MAASAWRVYNEAKKYMLTADADINAATMRVKIIKGGGAATVSNYATSTFASAGSGAAAANMAIKSLASIVVTAGASAKQIKFDAADPVFTASGGDATSCQYGVIGLSGGKAIAWCKLSTAAFNVTSTNTLTLTLNASGIFDLTGGTT